MQQKKTTKEEYQKCVNVVVEYINQHLGEDIDLKSLARISNFSPFYFHRIMKAFLGEPIGTFIVRPRTEAAARTGCTVLSIWEADRPGCISHLLREPKGFSDRTSTGRRPT